MRFLFLTQYYAPEIGAPQVRLGAVARQLAVLGHEVEVVTALPNHPTGRIFPEYQGKFYSRDEIDGIPVHRVWLYAATGAGLHRMANYGSFTLSCLWALAKCRRPDVLFVESPPLFLAVPAYLANLFWRARMVFNVADLWPDSVRALGLMKNERLLALAEWLELWSYRVSDKVNAVTEGIRETLVAQKAVPPSKITFLPNGVDTALFRPTDPDIELAREMGAEGKIVFLYTGTLGYAQGLETVLQAARRLMDRPDILFMFVGDGSERKMLEDLAKDLNLSNVMFIPPVPLAMVARLYSFARGGLAVLRDLPLFRGARPSKVFPVMSSGVPVVYSGAGEGANLVQSVNAGVTVPPEDSAALAAAVRRLADDAHLAQQMGANGRNYVMAHLSWSALVVDWLRQLDA